MTDRIASCQVKLNQFYQFDRKLNEKFLSSTQKLYHGDQLVTGAVSGQVSFCARSEFEEEVRGRQHRTKAESNYKDNGGRIEVQGRRSEVRGLRISMAGSSWSEIQDRRRNRIV